MDADIIYDIDANFLDAKQNTKENVKLHFFTNKKVVEGVSPDLMKQQLGEMLKQVAINPVFGIYNTAIQYSSYEQPPKDGIGNTRIEVNLPYCLHIPNGFELVISLNEKDVAHVFPVKIWTGDAAGSSEVDVFAEGRTTYFQKSILTTAKIPQNVRVGWDIKHTGQNVQKINDTAGVFRYTKLQIFIDSNCYESIENNKDWYKILQQEIGTKTLEIVNRILDAYRFVTNETYVERLSFLNIIDIYFYQISTGFHPTSPNIEAAIMNRSQEEIDRIEGLLNSNTRPPLYELLLLNSQRSFEKNMLTLALVESFQALEIFLENLLTKKFMDQGLDAVTIEQKLNQTWRTKERLKDLLKEATGHSLLEERTLWDKWCTIYDNDRNEVIHHGKESTVEETAKSLELNNQVIAWIKKLQEYELHPRPRA